MVSKIKQYAKVILPAIFLAVLSISSMATICMGYSMYSLGVKEGDWVEYEVMEAENYKFFEEIHSGDRLRFEVVGTKIQERMDPYGTVVFEVEAPVCDVFLNGECIQRNVELGEMLFLPKGEEHWRELGKIEEAWKEEAPKYGTNYESDITIGRNTVSFSYQMEGAVNGGAKQTVDKDTGVALEFERYWYVGEERSEYRLVISDTNISGILAPWYVKYRYFIFPPVVGAIIAFVVLRRHKKVFRKD